MDEITSLWDRLSLTSKEVDKVDLSGTEGLVGGLLAAKFSTRPVLNIEAVMRTLKPLWRAARGFKGRDMGKNGVLFIFNDALDMERVLANEPWSFDKSLILLKRIKDDKSFSQVSFDSCYFWVQIHDLPARYMNAVVCGKIGSTLGKVKQVEELEEGCGGGNFMRVRVLVDVTQPLCRGRKVGLGSAQDAWVSFKYERLPVFCYWCGIICHVDRDCELWLKSRGTLSPELQQYGPWLRGEVVRSFRRAGDDSRGPSHPHHMPEFRGGVDSEWWRGRANKENGDFPSPAKKVTSRKSFEDQLKDIDNDLGLDSGWSNEPLTLPNKNTSAQNSNSGSVRMGHDVAKHAAVAEPRLADVGPNHVKLLSKPNRPMGGTWKRITREPSGPKSPDGHLHLMKRGQSDLLDLDPEKGVKKPKNGADDSVSCAMKISAVVAEQPHRMP